jgi:hypothetical protein
VEIAKNVKPSDRRKIETIVENNKYLRIINIR